MSIKINTIDNINPIKQPNFHRKNKENLRSRND